MKCVKYIAVMTAMIIISAFFSGIYASAVSFKPKFQIASEAAVMINLDKDITVYEKNATKKMYPASLTKIMTAIVVLDNVDDLEHTKYEAPLVVFDDLYLTGALTLGYCYGEVITVKDLMYSMLVYSACESAGILAYNVGGDSMQNFVDMMNKKAEEIGCTGTHFVNPHGLHDKKQYTNAHDMALIAEYAVKNYPEFTEIACTQEYTLGATNIHDEGWRKITHSNKMMNMASEYYYPYAKGIKTGTTDESGRNLISMAENDGSRYLLVTMGAPMYDEDGNDVYRNFEDQIKLYDWAFGTLSYRQIVPKGKEITEIPVRMGNDQDFVRLVTAESVEQLWSSEIDENQLKPEIDVSGYTNEDKSVDAPVSFGQKLGTYTLSLNGEEICKVDLVAQESVSLSFVDYNIKMAKDFFGSFWFRLALIILAVLIVLYAVIVLTVSSKQRRKLKRVRRSRKF
ncbi:MAG: D-alanyl-D-alanine carboxypeptidase [Oscillospiraceae bacterium]|nr:D-alanyl-D-alanine carboxypeptidase [Oscillospiraceae bacterium]